MKLVAIGVSQYTAPLHIRTRLAFPADVLQDALARLREVATERFILSTCNRSEVYAVLPDASVTALHRFLAAQAGLTDEELSPYLYSYTDAAAVSHLLRVAAGLDSMVLGEEQILAQVKAALEAAGQQGGLGGVLHRLGQIALACGKQVRTNTKVSRKPLSVVTVALDLAAREQNHTARRVLVVGAGRTAELALKHLRKAKPGADCTVINRTYERARLLAERYDAAATSLNELIPALTVCDFAICCTSSPTPLIDATLMRRVMDVRQRPILMLDLAVPRDIDPEVAQLEGVTLYDMDSLGAICAANRDYREQEVAAAEGIVAEHTAAFIVWWQAREAAPTIAALRAHAGAIRDAEVAEMLSHLPALTAGEQAIVRQMAAQLVNKLLHHPITALKSPQLASNTALVRQLFGLDASAIAQQGEHVILSIGAEDDNYQ
ncbi:MAG: glutamyl-tRNA reductase [Candidatus Chloroheliales bacterium]|nr:MAG: glutamyl-tRNA reductase [Chloroflexota bacterium]